MTRARRVLDERRSAMSMNRSLRALRRELADALHGASASRSVVTVEGLTFAITGVLLASALSLSPPGQLPAQVSDLSRLPLTLVCVLLPMVALLRGSAVIVGSEDPRRTRVDDAAIALSALLMWAEAIGVLPGVRWLALDAIGSGAVMASGGALIGLGLVGLLGAMRRLTLEARARRWAPARMREVSSRELPRRVLPILLGPSVAATAVSDGLPPLAWLAVLGLTVHAVASFAVATRKRASFAL